MGNVRRWQSDSDELSKLRTIGQAVGARLAGNDVTITFTYINHEGTIAVRTCKPVCLYYGTTVYHPAIQWLLSGFDTDKHAARDYAVSGMVFLDDE